MCVCVLHINTSQNKYSQLTIKLSRRVVLCDGIASRGDSRIDGTRAPGPMVTPTTSYGIGKGGGGWSGGRRMKYERF